ncbi:MAG TPA: hypothetical protein VJV05_01825 [Pyrinomonadaceae bacterium]|nr:hypothetical protein [Pyrinomonadaceae bacterium]
MQMLGINESEFARIVDGLVEDRESIIKHNPIGTPEETLLWMLMSCLVSYLSLDDSDTPCFTGRPDAETYKTAIRFIVSKRGVEGFDPDPYLDKLTQQ